MKKHVFGALAAAAVALGAGGAAAQDKIKIGFVDIQRAISESQSGKKARERFQSEIKKAESDLMKEKQEVERLKADMEKKGMLLKEDEKRNRSTPASLATTASREAARWLMS